MHYIANKRGDLHTFKTILQPMLWCKNKLEKKVELGHFWQIKKMAHFSCQCQLCVNYPPTSNEKEWQNYNKNEKKKVSYLCIQILYFLHLVQYAALIVFLVYALKVPHVVFTCTHVDICINPTVFTCDSKFHIL